MNCGSVETGVGRIRIHPSTSPGIGPRRRRQGRRSESKKTGRLNRLRTGVGRYRTSIKKCGLADSAAHGIESVASQNRQLITSSTAAAHYIVHHRKMASSKCKRQPHTIQEAFEDLSSVFYLMCLDCSDTLASDRSLLTFLLS